MILRVLVNRTAVGTPLEGGITYLREAYGLGSNIGTAAPVVSGTHVAPINCLSDAVLPDHHRLHLWRDAVLLQLRTVADRPGRLPGLSRSSRPKFRPRVCSPEG